MPSIPRAVNLLTAKARHAKNHGYRVTTVSISELAMMNFTVAQRHEVAQKVVNKLNDNSVRITYLPVQEAFKIRISNF